MNVYLQVEHLTKSFGARVLFDDLSFGVDEGEKIGLIAKNGTGKSTLLNILAADEAYDAGKITWRNRLRVGYLQQIPVFSEAKTVMETCLEGDAPKAQAVRAYETALRESNAEAITAASALMDATQAWDYEERFKQILTQLKITDLMQRVDELSGGQVKRVALAKILIDEPQFIILDEPTNHLDIDMIEWLEDYLKRSRITILMVTHDRYFLDTVCNKIFELDQQQLFVYKGNYDYYLNKRAERLEQQTAAAERAQNLFRTELEWMRRQPQARQHKAQYRIDAFYDLQERARQRYDSRDVQLNARAEYIGKKIFIAHDVNKAYADKVILKDFNYTFARYEKLGIVGNNGVGKSTFIKLLLGQVEADSGYFEVGETVRFGYYSQEGIKFGEGKCVLDALRDIAEYVRFDEKTQYSAMQFLNHFLFVPAEQQKLISSLSGGERRRLELATVLYRKPNFLILDEPTNDLDIATLEILEDYLVNYDGCLIVVSHDRFFMDRTVDHTFVFEGEGKIKDFPGGYSEYRTWVKYNAQTKVDKTVEKSKEKTASTRVRTAKPVKLTFKEKKEFETLTAELEALNAERERLEAQFASGVVDDNAVDNAKRYEEIKSEIDEKEMRWLELSEVGE